MPRTSAQAAEPRARVLAGEGHQPRGRAGSVAPTRLWRGVVGGARRWRHLGEPCGETERTGQCRAGGQRQAPDDAGRTAQTLENAIDQHWKKLSQGRRWFTGEGRRPRASSLSDELLYVLLEEDTANQYAVVDQLLGASAVAPKQCDFIPKLRIEQGADGVSFHHQELRLLPFPVSNVFNALQNSLSHGDGGRPMLRVRKLWKSENYAQATTSVKLNLPNSRQAEVKARIVQRVFTEASRHVFVWSAYVEIEGSTFVRLEEKGWITLEPYEFKTNGCTTGSKLHTVIRVTPILQFVSEEDEKLHVGKMTDLVVDTYKRNFGLLYQVLENLMLDTAMNESE